MTVGRAEHGRHLAGDRIEILPAWLARRKRREQPAATDEPRLPGIPRRALANGVEGGRGVLGILVALFTLLAVVAAGYWTYRTGESGAQSVWG